MSGSLTPKEYDRLRILVNLYRTGEKSGSASLEDFAKELRDLYVRIPVDSRRFCLGDMDSKDHAIKFILNKHNLEY